ncbi:MAG: amidohydrolase [Gaiellales bacterium]
MNRRTVITGGPILTMADPGRVEAVALLDERILHVGALDDCRAAAGAGARELDLGGRTLMPGFVDAHTHPLMLGQCAAWVDCAPPEVTTIDGLVEMLGRRRDGLPPTAPVWGFGVHHGDLDVRRNPVAADLDRVATDRVVAVMHRSGHGVMVNSRCLADNGITRELPDPAGGRIERDASGAPTGVLWDAAIDLITGPEGVKTLNHGPNIHIPDAPERLVDLLCNAQTMLLRAGVTSVTDCQVTRREMETYLSARDDGRLQLRVSMLTLSTLLEALVELGLRSRLGDDHLAFAGLKLYADGTLTGLTAYFESGYRFDPCHHGQLYHEPEELRRLIRRAHRFGLQTGTHAQGDSAIAIVLEAVREALSDVDRTDHRHRIEHCGMPSEGQVAEIAELGVIPVNQPTHHYLVGDALLEAVGERAHRYNPYGEFARAGIAPVLSSDTPVSGPDPLEAVWAAATRATRYGSVLGDEAQRITVEQGLRGYTIEGARATRREHAVGSLEAGKLADLVVLSDDPLAVPLDDLRSIAVEETWVDGAPVDWARL